MKSFAAALFATAFLAGAAEAASNSKTWTGTAVVADGKTMTPSASSDWAIDTTTKVMTVSYKTTATLATGTMLDDDEQQVWWCASDMQGDSKTHCHMWAFQYDEGKKEQTFKGRVLWSLTSTGLPTPTVDSNAKTWFSDSLLWTTDSEYEYEKIGTGALTMKNADADTLNYKWGTASISGKVATGTLKKTYDATTTTMLKKGKLFTGVIGAYYKTEDAAEKKFKKTSRKEMQVGIAAEGKGAAASLYTTLGAIAVGVVALAF